jgi:hypothetical protein
MTVSPRFDAAHASWHGSALASKTDALRPGGICRLRIASVRDTRIDPRSVGSMGGFDVHFTDTAGWISSALNSLGSDPAIRIVTEKSESDLVLDVEIVKAYIDTITAEKIARVVLRVHASGWGVTAPDHYYSGNDRSVDWINGRAETEGALNDALTNAVRQIDKDVVTWCGG